MFHPGYIESCHEQKDAKWYRERQCVSSYCDNLESGGFIPCGESNNHVFCFVNGDIQYSHWLDLSKFNIFTCNFVFGHSCMNKILKRRWSCCGASYKGTLTDMINIKGCTNNYNKTN